MAVKKVVSDEKKAIHNLLNTLAEKRGTVSTRDYESVLKDICDQVQFPKEKLFEPRQIYISINTDEFEVPGVVENESINEDDFKVEIKVSYKGKLIKGVSVDTLDLSDY